MAPLLCPRGAKFRICGKENKIKNDKIIKKIENRKKKLKPEGSDLRCRGAAGRVSKAQWLHEAAPRRARKGAERARPLSARGGAGGGGGGGG